jgi:hypothetical protein
MKAELALVGMGPNRVTSPKVCALVQLFEYKCPRGNYQWNAYNGIHQIEAGSGHVYQ